jgi:hypothetical protein
MPFAYGPLAHFLKNRLYIGETRHNPTSTAIWLPV